MALRDIRRTGERLETLARAREREPTAIWRKNERHFAITISLRFYMVEDSRNATSTAHVATKTNTDRKSSVSTRNCLLRSLDNLRCAVRRERATREQNVPKIRRDVIPTERDDINITPYRYTRLLRLYIRALLHGENLGRATDGHRNGGRECVTRNRPSR